MRSCEPPSTRGVRAQESVRGSSRPAAMPHCSLRRYGHPCLVRPLPFIRLGCTPRHAAEQGQYTPSWRRQQCHTACLGDCVTQSGRSFSGGRTGEFPCLAYHSLDTSEDIYTSIAFIDMIHRSIAQYVDGRTDLHALTASVAL